jgi:aspartyl-tRNA synthetase
VLCNEKSIRDVIAFPKAASGRELLTGSPSAFTPAQLTECGLSLTSQPAAAANQAQRATE